jgi:release factor glutamine methyltransferase
MFESLLADISKNWQWMPDKPHETPESTLRALWQHVTGADHADHHRVLDDKGLVHLHELLNRRKAGEPLSYLLGYAEFMGLRLHVGAEALIPRKETEILAGAAIEAVRDAVSRQGTATVLDMCTGSGNVALAIAYHVPAAFVWGGDLSDSAVMLATRNAESLGLAGRAKFLAGDFLEPFNTAEFHGKVDVLTCNPPYISSARVDQLPHEMGRFEPRMAFDGGPFGVKFLMNLVKEAPRFVKSGGFVCCEIGVGQGASMKKMFEKNPAYGPTRMFTDNDGNIRALVAELV